MPDASAMPMIALHGVSRRFRRADGETVAAVAGVSLSVPEGQFVCLVGPSGCGKSTLLQLVAGLLPPSDGRIEVAAAAVTGPGPERGVVFQKDSVFPWMRVRDNVEYGLKCRGVAKAERHVAARRYLGAVGLERWERSWPRELSGGMLKRVAIATVFANGARVLLLDEPFGALDYVTKRQLHDVLLTLWAETDAGQRRTVLFVTHDVDEALLLADRILVMHSGRVVDDLAVTAPRPRDSDSLLLPEMVDRKHALLAHLGLERFRPGAAAAPARAGHGIAAAQS
ncbi:MAG: ABC transporter ATP-binding protein [Alphaproteobacteria bacterium]|nr:ABC transporter ATP-binding protein [Alphaproteobacteria bacterium]